MNQQMNVPIGKKNISNKFISKGDLQSLKPFLSILIIISTLFGLVFLQMEERRLGYELLRLNHQQRSIVEERRQRSAQLAKMTRPQYVEHVAQSRLTLKKLQSHQIIHLTGAQKATGGVN